MSESLSDSMVWVTAGVCLRRWRALWFFFASALVVRLTVAIVACFAMPRQNTSVVMSVSMLAVVDTAGTLLRLGRWVFCNAPGVDGAMIEFAHFAIGMEDD